MGKGAANMAALSRQVAKIPDESVAALVEWFVHRAEEVGGTFVLYGHKQQMSARIRSRKSRGRMASTFLAGTPATAWSIKSFGRRGEYVVRPRARAALSLRAFAPGVMWEHVTVHRETHGDGRWERLIMEADAKFPDVVADFVDRAVIS